MKGLILGPINKFRIRHPKGGMGDSGHGVFIVKSSSTGKRLQAVASTGEGWDHVSVSLPDRCPTWEEMAQIKKLFFWDYEYVIQYHPAKEDHINYQKFCLHLWRPQREDIPMPPKWMIA